MGRKGNVRFVEGLMAKDIVEILKEAGYGVVEGEEEVRKKIEEVYSDSVIKQFIPKDKVYKKY